MKSLEILIECAVNNADKVELGNAMRDFKVYCDKIEDIGRINANDGAEIGLCRKPIILNILAVIGLMRNLSIKITIMRMTTDDNNLARLLQDEMDFLRVDYLEPATNLVMSGSEVSFMETELKNIVNR